MRRWIFCSCCLFFLWFCGGGSVGAHGDLHERIAAATLEIQAHPKDPALYVKRGELHREHGEWDQALADLNRAAELAPGQPGLDLLRGRVFLEAGWPHSAVVYLDHFIAQAPGHVEARVTRARAEVKLSNFDQAAADYSAAIQSSKSPLPEFFIERSEALQSAGKPSEALASLDEGIKRLGPLVTLELYAIDLDVRQQRFDPALARLERIMKQSQRKETWLAKKGEILEKAGRKKEADAAFSAALQAIANLPPSRRHNPAMIELEKRLKAMLEPPPATSPNPK